MFQEFNPEKSLLFHGQHNFKLLVCMKAFYKGLRSNHNPRETLQQQTKCSQSHPSSFFYAWCQITLHSMFVSDITVSLFTVWASTPAEEQIPQMFCCGKDDKSDHCFCCEEAPLLCLKTVTLFALLLWVGRKGHCKDNTYTVYSAAGSSFLLLRACLSLPLFYQCFGSGVGDWT